MIWASAPYLNGKVYPWQVAMRIAWLGFRATRAERKPYLRATYGKAGYNGFATMVNRIALAAILISVPVGYYYMQNAKVEAVQKTVQVFKPGYDASKVIADPHYYEDLAVQIQLKHSVEIFQNDYGRPPNQQELEILKTLAQAEVAEDQNSVNTDDGDPIEMPQRAPEDDSLSAESSVNSKTILEVQVE